MDEDYGDPREELNRLFEGGRDVPFPLDVPCTTFTFGLRCDATNGYIRLTPYGNSFHYALRCENQHFVKNVSHAEVDLHFGIPKTAKERKAASIDVLTPPRRVNLFVIARDQSTCVYCGRRAGQLGLDGTAVEVSADHIIPKALIDVVALKLDRDIIRFARDVQLVTACKSDNSAKHSVLLSLDKLEYYFVRHVLPNKTGQPDMGLLQSFRLLHRLVEFNLKVKRRATS